MGTVTLNFIGHEGSKSIVDANLGETVMEAATRAGVDGIIAECNGSAACATCHVVFEGRALGELSTMTEHENDMLEFTDVERVSGSRLSCQVVVCSGLAGALITVPEN